MKTEIIEELKQAMQQTAHREHKKTLDKVDERIKSLLETGQNISEGTPEECYNYAHALHRILCEHQTTIPSLIGKDRDELLDFLRCKELEPIIMKSPEWAYKYALEVINGGHTNYPFPTAVWKEAEPYIMKDPKWAYKYLKNIINGDPNYRWRDGQERWEEAEEYILDNEEIAFEYADIYAEMTVEELKAEVAERKSSEVVE